MDTSVISQTYAITLRGDSYNGGIDRDITWRELTEGDIGDTFASSCNNCGRGKHVEILEIVYKNNSGCACLLTTETTYDTPDLTPSNKSSELIWFAY